MSQVRPERSLTGNVTNAAAWSSAANALRQILSFACVGILGHLLGPANYGLMAMAATVLAFILNFRDLGTAAAVMQRSSVTKRLLSSLFWVNTGVGLILTAAVLIGAGPAAVFFHEPRLVLLLRTLSLSFLLASLGIVQNAWLARQLAFREIAIADIASAVGGYLVAIPLAFWGAGVWSLAAANLTNSVISTALYWRYAGWTPGLEFDFGEVKEVSRFSLNLSGFGLVNYFARNADNVIVGRFLGQTPLGFYQTAYSLMLYPIQSISSVLGQVLLPAFSRISSDNARFRDAYTRSCMLIGLVTFPVMTGMAVVSDPLVRAVLGNKWLPVIALFRLLAPIGLLQSLQTTVGHIYVAKGRTDWMLRWGIFSTLVLVPCFLTGVQFGVTGVALACFAGYVVFLGYLAFAIPFRLIGLSTARFCGALLPQLGISLAMGAVCAGWLVLLNTWGMHNAWTQLITTSLLGCAVYIGLLIRISPPVMKHLREALADNPRLARFASKTGVFGRYAAEEDALTSASTAVTQ